ncbi:hypothetical protein IQ07DRAFT_603269 [Pyrenochaeta sp. DS3sAY3a]|nr:hypothetical protein IQ07DRAFT_603269 [Pyrenochaeta sp. DS3sAY3a]
MFRPSFYDGELFDVDLGPERTSEPQPDQNQPLSQDKEDKEQPAQPNQNTQLESQPLAKIEPMQLQTPSHVQTPSGDQNDEPQLRGGCVSSDGYCCYFCMLVSDGSKI